MRRRRECEKERDAVTFMRLIYLAAIVARILGKPYM